MFDVCDVCDVCITIEQEHSSIICSAQKGHEPTPQWERRKMMTSCNLLNNVVYLKIVIDIVQI